MRYTLGGCEDGRTATADQDTTADEVHPGRL